MSLAQLEQAIAYQFRQSQLLKQAITHRSFGIQHNERLEFLGDSVLNCTVAWLLYSKFPLLPEGVLSRLRANLVCQHSLHDIAQQLDLGPHLLLGDGEVKSGGRKRPSILADALESVFGAVFIDGGFEQAQQVIARLFESAISDINPDTPGKDAKTLLQEYLQGKRLPLPDYTLINTRGQAHEQTFHVTCTVPSLSIETHGAAASRRAAEQAAAHHAWQAIQNISTPPGHSKT